MTDDYILAKNINTVDIMLSPPLLSLPPLFEFDLVKRYLSYSNPPPPLLQSDFYYIIGKTGMKTRIFW